MVKFSLCVNSKSPSILPLHSHSNMHECKIQPAARVKTVSTFAAKSSGFSSKPAAQGCQKCGGKGAIECPGCKGTGRNKKNGNIFERWKCFDCQGFGLKSCPNCGKGGLTPEQRGER